jgi:hypothetical protein
MLPIIKFHWKSIQEFSSCSVAGQADKRDMAKLVVAVLQLCVENVPQLLNVRFPLGGKNLHMWS